jgi:hypothetical protein
MANEIKILVRVQNSGKAGFEEVGRDVDAYAKKFSESFSRNFSDNLSRNLTQTLKTQLNTVGQAAQDSARRSGDDIGNTLGQRISDRITEKIKTTVDKNGRLHDAVTGRFLSGGTGGEGGKGGDSRDRDRVKVDVDIDKQSFLSKLSSFGKEAGEKFSGFFSQGFGAVFNGDLISVLIKVIAGGALAFALAPVLGAAFTAALGLGLGGGAIVVGLVGAFKDPRIQSAVKGLKAEVSKTFEGFAENFKGPLENFLAGSGKGGSAGLIGVFRSLKPMIDSLGKALGPLAQKLGDGIIGMLQNMLPGIIRAIEKSVPIVEKLAEKLPKIGDAIGRFFDNVSDGAPQAAQFLGDFLDGVALLIRILGRLIEAFTSVYGTVRSVFLGIIGFVNGVILGAKDLWNSFNNVFNNLINKAGQFLSAAAASFGWIPGIGPKLKNAENQFNNFKNKANASLSGISRNVAINVKFNVVGLAAANAAIDTARLLSKLGYAAGGVVGQAASGGARSGMAWVGEHGPELVDLPPGSRVYSSGDSNRMAGQDNGRDVTVRLVADRTTERGVVDALFRMFRAEIQGQFQGDVQLALGS